MLVLIMMLGGCTEKGTDIEQQQQDSKVQGQPPAAGKTPAPSNQPAPETPVAKPVPMPSESATKIYLGLRQAGVDDAVVDVQQDEVVIGLREQTGLNNEALVYYAFGLAAKFESEKQKTTVLIFQSDGKRLEAGIGNAYTTALTEGKLTDQQYKEKVGWMK